MQFEDFDNKIRQAADQHHPNYDGTAWAKMEKLLEKHLPQDNPRRRRIIMFLLCFLLLGGGTFLVINKSWENNKTQITNSPEQGNPSASSSIPGKDIQPKKTESTLEVDKLREEELTPEQIIKDPAVTAIDSKEKAPKEVVSSAQRNAPSILKSKKPESDKSFHLAAGNIVKKDFTANNNGSQTGVKSPAIPSLANQTANPSSDNTSKAKLTNRNSEDLTDDLKSDNVMQKNISPTKNDSVTTEQPAPPAEEDIITKRRKKKSDFFFFSLSAGPDISSVGVSNPGKTKLLTGVGLGYSFANRWMLRTGLYSVSKIYSATLKDYKPYSTPPNPAYLEKIDADCRIYEIPLSLAYSFSRSEKNKGFASVGLSSYLMKKETYDYLYKYPGGATHTTSWTYKNEHKHYFSVLTLSGGYQRKISKTFGFMVEPYMKIPLAGVGHGKVKLNSAGVLVSLNFSPFNSGVKK